MSEKTIKCEYCKVEYDLMEILEERDFIPEHFYCSKWCYDKDGEDSYQFKADGKTLDIGGQQ